MEIKLYKSPWKALLLLVVCLLFVAIGIWMLNDPEADRFWAWCCIGFFGLGVPLSLFNMFDRRPQIILNEVGVFDRTAFKQVIPWDVIRDAYLLNINQTRFICLIVDKQYEPSRKKGRFMRGFTRMSKSLTGAQELNINLAAVSVDATKLGQFVLEMARLAPEARRERVRAGLLPAKG
ncbi:STM3941 family protein [Dawidia soli]|uniref:PH domain-containing protein n=1 Tax=Dawidia soli TaxID=2782352 RepID=A0AAP2DCU4_9BACT|nr:STM3941 family protein [Dawidia soli]MBT1688450.1 hypothetical protein [Dawidia soli]